MAPVHLFDNFLTRGGVSYTKHKTVLAAGSWEWVSSCRGRLRDRVSMGGLNVWWETLNQEVMRLFRAGHYDRAVVLAQKALQVAEQNVGPDHPHVAASLYNLALLYQDQGAYAQAEPLYKRSLAIREKALGPDHPDVAASLENLAVLYLATDRGSEALALSQRAAKIRAMKR